MGPETELARAKVNLTLHVTGRRPDRYHTLDSLVVFAELGDVLSVEPAEGLSLTLAGPFGWDLPAGGENLVMQAALALRPPGRGAALRLEKSLPVAAGLGGGSADAAAALRLLARHWGVGLPEAPERLGADVPACVLSRPLRMRGIGEDVALVAGLPEAWLVLVNNGRPVATPSVFGALERRDNPGMEMPAGFASVADLAGWLAEQRNDLEAPATAVEPGIAAVLEALAGVPGCLLARMSGSGGTCFGLFAGRDGALAAADALRRAEPGWWVAAAAMGR